MAIENSKNKITIQGRDLIEELGIETFPEEKQVEIIEKINQLFWKKILLRIVDKLSEKEIEELNSHLEKGEHKEADQYVAAKIPDFPSFLQEELNKFQGEMIEKIKAGVV